MYHGIGDIRVENIDTPRAAPGEIVARVRAALTCGTDVKVFVRGYPAKQTVQRAVPYVFGHEWAGDIYEIGDGVKGYDKGTRVEALQAVCMNCHFCRRGVFNRCINREGGGREGGAFAEYFRIPKRVVEAGCVVKIPDHLSYEEASLSEPLSTVLHGQCKVEINVGDIVAIIGAGPIGLFHLQLAKLRGAGRTIVSDLVRERLCVAKALGADELIYANEEDPVDRVMNLTHQKGANVVIEAVGTRDTWEQAIKMAAEPGTVLEFAGCPEGTEINFSAEKLHYGELTIVGSYNRTPVDSFRALELLSSGRIEGKSLITRTMSLDEAPEAFQILRTDRREEKIALIP